MRRTSRCRDEERLVTEVKSMIQILTRRLQWVCPRLRLAVPVRYCDQVPGDKEQKLTERPSLPASDLCCQTGCPRCVFAVFADELIAYCEATGRDPMSEVREITSDTNMRAIIQMLVREADSKSQ